MNINDIRRLAGLAEQEDYTAPDVGDIIDHKELGKVKVVEVTDSDTYGGPAQYRVEVVLSHDELVGAVELGSN